MTRLGITTAQEHCTPTGPAMTWSPGDTECWQDVEPRELPPRLGAGWRRLAKPHSFTYSPTVSQRFTQLMRNTCTQTYVEHSFCVGDGRELDAAASPDAHQQGVGG